MVVQNLSSVDQVDIDILEDDLYDLGGGCAAGFSLAPGGDFYECSFSADVLGNAGSFETNVVTASGLDDDGQPVSDKGAATVRIIGAPPSLELRKIALPPLALDGGTVTYLVVIKNTSSPTDPVTIDTLTDTIDGNTVTLDNVGTCTLPQTLQPEEIYTCTFSMTVNGNPGDQVIDTVTASGSDDDGQAVTASDQATVTIIEIPPVTADLRIAKFAAPAAAAGAGW